MRILWLTNKILPQIAQDNGINSMVVNEGWLNQTFSQLLEADHQICVICCGSLYYKDGKFAGYEWHTIKEGMLEETQYSESHKNRFRSIINNFNPDVIHVWGTEYPHSLAMIDAADECGMLERLVLSVQGLISFCAMPYYYYCNLPEYLQKKRTFYEYVRKTSIADGNIMFQKRGAYEIKALRKAKYVIGRTEWDKSYIKAINPDIGYFFCNETLRKEFYNESWSYEECQKHSIFVSQASYPLKGFHNLLDALKILVNEYEDLHVYVSGSGFDSNGSFLNLIKRSTYAKYIKKTIEEYGLNSFISFVGRLDAVKMRDRYLKSNVFVSLSSVENSSNSIGEAMLLGTPVVASDAGGTRSIIVSGKEGILYPWDSMEELINAIKQVFSNTDQTIIRSNNARIHARNTHDSDVNFKTLLEIYKSIL